VVKEEAEIGEIVLLARWQREPPPVSSQDCLHLFRYLLSNLSLALTLLRQHQQAAEFARIHDIGTAALMAAHDEYNLADRAEAVLNEVHRSAANEPLLKKVDTILQHIRAVGRTRVQFVRKKRIRLEPDDLCNCSQMVREWFMDLAWLIADDFIQIDHAFELDRHVFLAGRDGVLACLRNLQSNAVKAVQSAEKEPFWIRCDATYRTPVDTDENLADCALQYVVLAVANSGKCIPQNLKLFEHRIAESASGHGLGSQIVRWVMDEHRGLIQYTSRDGETRIELWFPNLRDPSLEDIQIQWVKYDEYRNRVGPVRRGE
jgi:signal transduction histidine kinase